MKRLLVPVSDGYWLMLAPLRKGQHTLTFGGTWVSADPSVPPLVT